MKQVIVNLQQQPHTQTLKRKTARTGNPGGGACGGLVQSKEVAQ